MRRFIVVAGLVTLGCADPAPTGTLGDARSLTPSLSMGDGAAFATFNTQLRAEDEIPLPAELSDSKGHAHLKVVTGGAIESHLKINNSSEETLLVCHIHAITRANGTGPFVWFLTPTLVNKADRHFEFRQDGAYSAATSPFPSEATARAAFDANPANFYVNCHSAKTPAGFIRGNLQ